MAEYTLNIRIDQEHVKHFNTSGYRLCLASGMESGGEVNYNVVAFSSFCAANVQVTWKEEYQIAATRDGFSAGRKFTVSTTPQSIQFGESYLLPADWTDQGPNADPHAPHAGFMFVNETPVASAVVFKTINGQSAPIYLSAAGPLPPGKEALTPKTTVGVWFQNDSEAGTMISDFDTDRFDVDFTGTTTQTIRYNNNGVWAVDS